MTSRPSPYACVSPEARSPGRRPAARPHPARVAHLPSCRTAKHNGADPPVVPGPPRLRRAPAAADQLGRRPGERIRPPLHGRGLVADQPPHPGRERGVEPPSQPAVRLLLLGGSTGGTAGTTWRRPAAPRGARSCSSTGSGAPPARPPSRSSAKKAGIRCAMPCGSWRCSQLHAPPRPSRSSAVPTVSRLCSVPAASVSKYTLGRAMPEARTEAARHIPNAVRSLRGRNRSATSRARSRRATPRRSSQSRVPGPLRRHRATWVGTWAGVGGR